MDIDLPYAEDKLIIRMPSDVKIDYILPEALPVIENIEDGFVRACEEPVDATPVSRLAGRGKKVLILISDFTRDQGTFSILTLCIQYLKKLKLDVHDIGILIARGTHRELSKEERNVFKQSQFKGITVEEHDCDDGSSLCALMLTSRGTPVRINRKLKEADLVILLSPISFHYFAGFGGGRKLVLPGASARNSIVANHHLSLMDSKPVMLNPFCGPAKLEGNPVHEDMCEALAALNNVFAVNFFSNVSGELVFLNAGSPYISHIKACDAYKSAFAVNCREKYDFLIVSAGGFPGDVNFLQSHKALRNASYIANPKGIILLAAQCREGIGSQDLEEALKIPREVFLRRAYEDYRLNNQTAVSLRNLTSELEIAMLTELDDKWLAYSGIARCENPEAFVANGLARKSTERVVVMPYGGKTLPQLKR